VLVFSPRLALDSETPVEAALFGVVTAAATGLSLPGVTVQVTGSTTATAQTDSSGAYRLAPLATGPLTIEARLTGYDTVRASTTVVAQAQIGFSPALYPSSTTPPGRNASSLTGVVLDASTSAPLPGVTVEAAHGGSTVVQETPADGRFTVTNITVAEVSLRLTLAGYRASAMTLFLEPLAVIDLGQVRLRPEAVVTLLPDLVVTAVDSQTTSTDPTRWWSAARSRPRSTTAARVPHRLASPCWRLLTQTRTVSMTRRRMCRSAARSSRPGWP